MAVELIIFAGLQAAGKTTFYRSRFAATHLHVSKDLMSNARRKGERQARLVAEALEAGQSVVVDNTNPSVTERAELTTLGRVHGAEVIGYYFDAPVMDSLRRNRDRVGKARVPDVAIFDTRKRLAPPSYAEGFDRLYRVRIAGSGRFSVEEIARP